GGAALGVSRQAAPPHDTTRATHGPRRVLGASAIPPRRVRALRSRIPQSDRAPLRARLDLRRRDAVARPLAGAARHAAFRLSSTGTPPLAPPRPAQRCA